MRRLLAAGCLLAGCGVSRPAHFTSAATGFLTLAVDWCQTRQGARSGWSDHWERNPILGNKPSVEAVNLYFVAVIGVFLLSQALPRSYSTAINAGLTGVETGAILNNMQYPKGQCQL